MQYNIQQLADILQGKIFQAHHHSICQVSIDSRNLPQINEGLLFICLKGSNHNAHVFVPELINRGVKTFLVSEESVIKPGACFILVNDGLRALQQLAAFHRKQFKIPVVGITGSNGKTIVKEWLAQLIGHRFKLIRSPRSYNSQVGVPLSVLQMDTGHQLAIFEAGISKPGEMEQLEKIIQPTIGILTHMGDAHQENFHSMEQKIAEKAKLFKSCKQVYLVKQQEYAEFVEKLVPANLISINLDGKPVSFSFVFKEGNSEVEQRLNEHAKERLVLPGNDIASAENALLAYVVAMHQNWVPADILKNSLSKLQPVAMRLEIKHGQNQTLLINDAYNSDAEGLGLALDFLCQKAAGSKTLAIISDVYQSGLPDDILYPKLAQMLKEKNIDGFIGIGQAIKQFAHHFLPGSLFYADTDEFLRLYPLFQLSQSTILLKAARAFAFEKIVERLEVKNHETVLDINLNALIANLNYFRGLTKPETKIMVMVKAFTYGAGSYEIARALQDQKVDYLGVAFAHEGIELRSQGIYIPVMVMNPQPSAFDAIINHRLEPEIYSYDILHAFLNRLQANGESQYPVHIKIDSGMKRLGFEADDVHNLADILANNHLVKVKSVFSHLAGSDEAVHDDFTNRQAEVFDKASSFLSESLGYPFIRHILNSAGIERHVSYQYDMVRLGIGLHGISAVNKALQPVASLKTKIVQIKLVNKGESIGYSRKDFAIRDTIIAILPIGYADGLNRHLGNGKFQFLINGQAAPTIGNICMDLCMVDITGLDAKIYDEVIIFGEDLPISGMAEKLGTIPYEILTGISSRVNRVYHQE